MLGILSLGSASCNEPRLNADQSNFLETARSAILQCRKTVCETKFWENEDCAKAHAILNSKQTIEMTAENPGSFDLFFLERERMRHYLEEQYIKSLESEVGFSSFQRISGCTSALPTQFPAYDKLWNDGGL